MTGTEVPKVSPGKPSGHTMNITNGEVKNKGNCKKGVQHKPHKGLRTLDENFWILKYTHYSIFLRTNFILVRYFKKGS